MNESTTEAASIFAPLWKRKWMILGVAILVAIGTYYYYKRQTPTYTAETRLYLGSEQSPGSNGPSKSTLSGRAVTDQVEIINSAVIALPVRKRLRAQHQLAAAKGKAKASATAASDFITIGTEAHTPRAARDLADAIAAAYVARQRAAFLRSVDNQITNINEQLRRVESGSAPKGSKGSTSASSTIQAADLQSKKGQLESARASAETNFSGVQQVTTAKASPLPVKPKPKQNAIFGFVLGLILAAAAAYVLARFDRRVRSLSAIERMLGAELLAVLPSVRNPVRRPDGTRAPARPLVDPLRRLQTTLQRGIGPDGHPDRRPRTLLFLSPDSGDGRSSLVANLGRVMAEAGERVVILDADLRRPAQARLLDVETPNGLAEVLAGQVTLSTALVPVRTGTAAAGAEPQLEAHEAGSLMLLAGGGPVTNPPALLASDATAGLLGTLAEQFDRVLIDVPPPLEVSDAMPLLHRVAGILLVARAGHTRDISAERLAEMLQRTTTAPVLGIVANCVPRKDIERFGFVYSPQPQRSRKLIRR
jgi:non-specific protein-tyrosine kinase